MYIRLLGAVGLVVEDTPVTLPGGRLKTLLAVLALSAGQTVNRDQLIDELWPENLPTQPGNALQALIYRLRRHMRPYVAKTLGECLTTCQSGYELKVPSIAVDARMFSETYEDAGKILPTDPAEARRMIAEVLPLWQGSALQGVSGGPLCRSAALELEERRLGAVELDVRAAVMLNNPQVISDLTRLVSLYPWRERFIELLMVALYRTGRQVEALETYRRAHSRLVDELGLEPSPQLRGLAQAILNHENELLAVGVE